jgi:ABC-type sugar transport system permease subunit
MTAVESAGSARARRTVSLLLLLAAALTAASFPLMGPIPVGAGPIAPVGVRVVAGLIGAAGILGGLRAFRVGQQDVVRRVGTLLLSLAAALLVWFLYISRAGVRAAVVSVIVAVTVSAAIFVGANRWLDQVLVAWARFAAVTGLVVGAGLGAVLVGNRAVGLFLGTAGSRTDRSLWLIPIIALATGGYGVLLAVVPSALRLAAGVTGGTALGALIGGFLRVGSLPTLDGTAVLLSLVVLAGAGAALARSRGRDPLRGAVTGAGFGWLIGTFGFAELGSGTIAQGLIGTIGLGALVGLRLGLAPERDISARLRLEARMRGVIFLAPALTFIAAALVIPTVRTVYLSLLDARSIDFVGFDNFRFIFQQPSFFDIENWRLLFSATEFIIFSLALLAAVLLAHRQRRLVDGVAPPLLLVAAVIAAVLMLGALGDRAGAFGSVAAAWRVGAALGVIGVFGLLVAYLRRNPGNSGFSGTGGGLLAMGALFLSLAVFTNLRGTLFNNLWWVVMVTTSATVLGLAIAALADRSKGESVAKSLIFMPMALSFVGAGIIWRFMYLARPANRPQTGVLNTLWVGIGSLSVSERALTAGVVLLVVAAGLTIFGVAGLRVGALGVGWAALLLAMWTGWLGARFLGGRGIAGASTTDGVAEITPLLFISGTQQVGAYNNLFIMIPFIWIYTGFAMVIFSAAIKGVPADLLEAGRVDGASESQAFWRIVLPQIRPTIGVVLTTIIVVVMKVFDIVKVMTNGNFGTQVLANEMWNRAFQDANFGVGSAVAVVLFLSVLPVMFVNIRRMQKDAA